MTFRTVEENNKLLVKNDYNFFPRMETKSFTKTETSTRKHKVDTLSLKYAA